MEVWKGLIPTALGSPGEDGDAKSTPGGMDLVPSQGRSSSVARLALLGGQGSFRATNLGLKWGKPAGAEGSSCCVQLFWLFPLKTRQRDPDVHSE